MRAILISYIFCSLRQYVPEQVNSMVLTAYAYTGKQFIDDGPHLHVAILYCLEGNDRQYFVYIKWVSSVGIQLF